MGQAVVSMTQEQERSLTLVLTTFYSFGEATIGQYIDQVLHEDG